MVLHLAAAVLSGSGSPACSLRPAEPNAMDPALPPPRPSSPRPQGTSGASSCVDERLEDAFKKLRGLRDGGLLSPNSYLTLCKDALHQSVEASVSASRSRLSDGSGGASSVAWRPLSRIHAGGPSAQAPTPPAPTPVERTALDVSFADSPVRDPLPPEDMIEGYEDSPIPVLHAVATPGPAEPEEAPVELGFAASQAGGGDIVERFGPVSPLNLRLQDIDEEVTRDHPERVAWRAIKTGLKDVASGVDYLKTLPTHYKFLRAGADQYKVYSCASHHNCSHLIRLRRCKDTATFVMEESHHAHSTEDAPLPERGLPHLLKKSVLQLLAAGRAPKQILNALYQDTELGPLATSLPRDKLYRQIRNMQRNGLRISKGPLLLDTSADLMEWSASRRFPDNIDICPLDALYVLPQGYRADLKAVVFSSRNVLSNLKRAFTGRPRGFSIMIDGTFKLHYGGFTLITAGVTTLAWSSRGSGLSQSFRPAAYCFASAESGDMVRLLLEAMKASCQKFFGFTLSPKATHADRSTAIDNALSAAFPMARRTTCWSHVSRKFTEGSFKGDATAKTLRSFSPMIEAIHLSRTRSQAKAIGDVVVREMEKAGAPATAHHFRKEYLSAQWLTWYCGVVGPGYPPSTNAQESYHRQLKQQVPNQRLRRATDELLHSMFPDILKRDGTWLCGDDITMDTPNTMPSEYVHEAAEYKKLAEHNPNKVHMFANFAYYVKTSLADEDHAKKVITQTWVAEYEKGLRGVVNQHYSIKRLKSVYHGLCKVSVDAGGKLQTCDCPMFIRYMCCPHWVYILDRQGHMSLADLTTKLGRVRQRGGGVRKPKRALERQPETPEKRKKRGNKN